MYKKKFKRYAIAAGVILSVALTMSGCKSNTADIKSYNKYAANVAPAAGATYEMGDYAYGDGGDYYDDYEYEYDYATEESLMAEPQAVSGMREANGGLDQGNIVDNGAASSR